MFRTAFPILAALPFMAAAQDMQLSTGTLTVSEGTHLRIEGPVTWQISEGAAVVNHGVIDLGEDGVLNEAPGAAITGTGVETATRNYPVAINGETPGGLGLTLGSGQAIGTLVLTRGHLPVTLANGAESIARWYHLDTDEQPGIVLQVEMQYDPSEINGLDAQELQLHKADAPESYWLPLPGEADATAHTVSAEMAWPWAFLSAFEADVVTNVPEEQPAGFLVWPTVSGHDLHIMSTGDVAIERWELFDMNGHLVDGAAVPAFREHRIDLTAHAPGAFILRVNGRVTIRIIKV